MTRVSSLWTTIPYDVRGARDYVYFHDCGLYHESSDDLSSDGLSARVDSLSCARVDGAQMSAWWLHGRNDPWYDLNDAL